MKAFPARRLAGDIDERRDAYGVEPVCRVLPAKSQGDLRGIAPSADREHAARRSDPNPMPARERRDAELCRGIRRVFAESLGVYGVRKVWRQTKREGFGVARCTVARLTCRMGLKGVVRGKAIRTTISDAAAPCPLDRVSRVFKAPRPNVPCASGEGGTSSTLWGDY